MAKPSRPDLFTAGHTSFIENTDVEHIFCFCSPPPPPPLSEVDLYCLLTFTPSYTRIETTAYPLFLLLLLFRKEKSKFMKLSECPRVFVSVPPSPFQISNQLTDCHEMWCEHYPTGSHPKAIPCNLLQPVITSWRASELRRCEWC